MPEAYCHTCNKSVDEFPDDDNCPTCGDELSVYCLRCDHTGTVGYCSRHSGNCPCQEDVPCGECKPPEMTSCVYWNSNFISIYKKRCGVCDACETEGDQKYHAMRDEGLI